MKDYVKIRLNLNVADCLEYGFNLIHWLDPARHILIIDARR